MPTRLGLKLRITVIVGLTALAAAPAVPAEIVDEDLRGPARIGETRPVFVAETPTGDGFNWGQVSGKTVVVDFFATWCEPCHRALGDLLTSRSAGPPDTVLLLVDLQEPPSVVRAWTARAHLPADAVVVMDTTGETYRRWGARKLPTTFIVDATGVVRHINRGWGPGYRARLTKWLQSLPRAPARIP